MNTLFHMIVTVLKIYFKKREAKVINDRDYRNFSNPEFGQQFLKGILKTTQNGDTVSYESNWPFANELLTPEHLRRENISDLITVFL